MYKIHYDCLPSKQTSKKKKKKLEREKKRKREKGMTKYLEMEKTNSTAYKASTL